MTTNPPLIPLSDIKLSVNTANLGMLGQYIDIPPGRIHADVPGVLFRVPEPCTSVVGDSLNPRVFVGLNTVENMAPVAYVVIRIGKQFIASAFNPLDPLTRNAMQLSRDAGELPVAIEFDYRADTPHARQYTALLSLPCDAFGAVLDATVGKMPINNRTWLQGLSLRVIRSLPTLGLTREEVGHLHVNCYAVLPVGTWFAGADGKPHILV